MFHLKEPNLQILDDKEIDETVSGRLLTLKSTRLSRKWLVSEHTMNDAELFRKEY